MHPAPRPRVRKHLYVFQRTPSSIDVRNNHPIDPDWFRTLEPGWQAEWLMNFTTLQTGGFTDEDLVMDGWTDISKRIRDKVLSQRRRVTRETFIEAYEDSDYEKMDRDPRPCRRPGGRSGRPPRRSSPGTASCASGRASTTSTSTPSTNRAPT